MAFNVDGLSIHQLMQLRVQINELITNAEEQALTNLNSGIAAKGYKLQEGRTTRVIKDAKQFKGVLQEAFGDQFEEVCMKHTIIALTAAEKLVKDNFEGDDVTQITAQIAATLGQKTSASKLVYVGVE